MPGIAVIIRNNKIAAVQPYRYAPAGLARKTKHLARMFLRYNERYFDGQLEATIAFSSCLKTNAGIVNLTRWPISQSTFCKTITYKRGDRRQRWEFIEGALFAFIKLHPKYAEISTPILKHEMIHVWCAQSGDLGDHGDQFCKKAVEIRAPMYISGNRPKYVQRMYNLSE